MLKMNCVLLGSLLGLTVGCDDGSMPVSSPGKPGLSGAGTPQEQHANRTLDQEFAHLAANVVPGGFGGWFWDERGRPNVYLVDLHRRDAAVAALLPILQARRVSVTGGVPRPTEVQVLQGQYDFAALEHWRGRIRMESQFIRGIVSTDVDERLNRIKIGVEDLAGEADVRQVLDRLGIPPAAVITKRAKRPPYTSTLLDRVRPLAGGYVIRWYRDAYSQIEGCTLGFNARRGTVNGFVTNSHCTETQGGWDGEEFFQHTMTASNSVGYEHSDPPFVSSFNCPQTFSCRYSDAAFVAYHTNSPTGESLFGLGQIAQTTYPPGQYSGSTTINSAHPRFYIRGEKAGPDWGEQVNKIGRTTGWTYGNVIETCSDQYRAGNKILWCQSVIDTGVGSGDSGSPVFVEDGFNQVILYGVVWGGVNGEVYFSNMSNIELDIGALDTM